MCLNLVDVDDAGENCVDCHFADRSCLELEADVISVEDHGCERYP